MVYCFGNCTILQEGERARHIQALRSFSFIKTIIYKGEKPENELRHPQLNYLSCFTAEMVLIFLSVTNQVLFICARVCTN